MRNGNPRQSIPAAFPGPHKIPNPRVPFSEQPVPPLLSAEPDVKQLIHAKSRNSINNININRVVDHANKTIARPDANVSSSRGGNAGQPIERVGAGKIAGSNDRAPVIEWVLWVNNKKILPFFWMIVFFVPFVLLG
jgi:hypothetical protein